MMSHECLHTVHATDFLQFGLERHGTSIALHGTQSGHFHSLQSRRIHQLLHSAVLHRLLQAPGNIDRRQFILVPGPEADSHQHDGDSRRQNHIAQIPAALHAHAGMDSLRRTNRGTLTAKRTIHGLDCPVPAVRNIDSIRTMLVADSAMRTFLIVLHDVQHLKFRTAAKYLQKISGNTEQRQKKPPRNIDTQKSQHVINRRENDDPAPELQRIRNRSERAQVPAPEHVDHESAYQDQCYRHTGHPQGDFTLESRRHSVIRVQILAEQLTCRGRHKENPEQQRVFDDAEDLVGNASVLYFNALPTDDIAQLDQKVLHSAERTDITAEQLAEKHDRSREDNTHDYLHHAHAARQ